MLRYCLLLLPVFIAACGSHSGNASTASGDSITASDHTPPTGNFYKRYSGTLAGKPVVVQLQRWDGTVRGSYQYTPVGQVIGLRNQADTSDDGQYVLSEIVPGNGSEGNGPGAEWSFSIHGRAVTGEWRSADSTTHYPLSLTEDYPAGSTRLDAFYMADSAALAPDKPAAPKAVITYSYLLPSGGTKGFLYDALRSQIAPQSRSGDDAAAAIKAANAAYFESYRKENASLLTPEPGIDAESFSFSYTSDETVSVLYNDDNWLITELFGSSYTGGAHGNYASSYANIDLQEQRVWTSADIITDTAALRPMLNDAAILYFHLKPGEGMEQRMLVDEVPPTGNVYLSATGLTFVYNPYEIASYADGQISLFLPYRKLLPFLTPAFRARMRLSERAGVAMLAALPGMLFSS